MHLLYTIFTQINSTYNIQTVEYEKQTKMHTTLFGSDYVVPTRTHSNMVELLTNLPLVPYICVGESGQHWLR